MVAQFLSNISEFFSPSRTASSPRCRTSVPGLSPTCPVSQPTTLSRGECTVSQSSVSSLLSWVRKPFFYQYFKDTLIYYLETTNIRPHLMAHTSLNGVMLPSCGVDPGCWNEMTQRREETTVNVIQENRWYQWYLLVCPLLSAGLLPAAGCLVAVSYVGCNHILTITFLTLSTSIGGVTAAGIYMNQIDIAPRWVSFTFSQIQSFLIPQRSKGMPSHVCFVYIYIKVIQV